MATGVLPTLNCGLLSTLERSSASHSIRIYPNPTHRYLTIESNEKVMELELLTLMGKKILQSSSLSLDLVPLPSEIYLLRLHFAHGMATQKVVLLR